MVDNMLGDMIKSSYHSTFVSPKVSQIVDQLAKSKLMVKQSVLTHQGLVAKSNLTFCETTSGSGNSDGQHVW